MGVQLLHRSRARLVALIAVSISLVACGPTPPEVTGDGEPVMISGRYRVKGRTVDPTSPHARKISGSVILVQDGDQYTATYELKTTFPAEGGFTDARVVGVGEGTIAGSTLDGTAHTQLVISAIPGMDTGFAFAPRITTTRIVSSSVAQIRPDGTIAIELENRPDAGQDYRPTRTRLTGRLVDSDPTPPVASR